MTETYSPTGENEQNQEHKNNDSDSDNSKSETIQRRQDKGFDFLNYFLNRPAQASQNQQQQRAAQPQQYQSQQQPLTQQQQQQLQQLILQQQRLKQLQQQLQQYQQPAQQYQQPAQQYQQQGRTVDINYQDNSIQQQQQLDALNRDGGYGNVGIGGGYQSGYAPKEIGISIGAGKPPNVVGVGNILTLLPRIINVLSAGGKVMFGLELGNNFYFGPVGAKPLGKAIYG
ncbi:regulator of nonsense transcripts 1-like [Uloborus diversus]|uniref:regulator of nonsense transcripts 1-like n=1 Tax=Uloborus diversus TaxID=327109 RepID=UPI0024091691|nr:regulator of nonsense transcripts 1-like [Uloborus diversus]